MFKHLASTSRLSNGSRGLQVPILFTVLALFVIALMLLFPYDGENNSQTTLVNQGRNSLNSLVRSILVNQGQNSFNPLVQFNPNVEVRNGTDVIWQIPDSPKGALFIAHGCNGRAANFWDKSSKCPHCVGLPEERLIVLHALARRFAVLTVSSAGRCWSFMEERLVIRGIIKWWVEEHKLEKLPLVALGASSGGYFISALANDMRFSSIVLMIAEGLFDLMDINGDYPPTLFVHMPKDEARKRRIDAYIKILRGKGIDVAELQCMEFPLSPTFLSDRVQGLDNAISKELFDLFQRKGFVDKNGYMRADGRALRLKAALKESKIGVLNMGLFRHIQEELNLAFAKHEMTSMPSEQIFYWFESHMSNVL